jgi:amino acid adenylation domain-containing protein
MKVDDGGLIEYPLSQNLSYIQAFWKQWLEGVSTATPLGIDRPASLNANLSESKFEETVFQLPNSLLSALNSLLGKQDINIQTLLLASWGILLSRYSGENDVVFGIRITSDSEQSDSTQAIANSLPMRVQVVPDISLISWLQHLQNQWKTLLSCQRIPLADVQRCSGIPTGAPLFESLLILSGTSLNSIESLYSPKSPNCPLTIAMGLSDGKVQIQYDCSRISNDTVTRLFGHLQTLLEGIVANPMQRLGDLPLLTSAEQQLLSEWSSCRVDYPRDKCIHQLFEEQVARSPNEIAVVLPEIGTGTSQHLTYQELNDRANCLALQLQQLGVQRGTLVVINMERAVELIVAIVGILKAGGVYVPVDSSYPAERIAWMLEDTQAPVILTQSHLVEELPSHSATVVCMDTGWGERSTLPTIQLPIVSATDLAYINYTSGSTGRPKGVAIPHRAVTRLVFGTNFTPLDSTQTLLQLAPVSFDAATLEIWGALLHGGRCVLYPSNGIPDPQTLGAVIQQCGVTIMWLTAALFNTLISESPEALRGVKELLTGGEALSINHIRRAQQLLPDTQFINGYGPTESTTFTCCYRIPHSLDNDLTSIPLGKPIANTEVYILDAMMQPVPIGVPGELYVGGDGLAREYINRPDLTQEKFIPHPFSSDSTARLYKTGDQVRFLPDGNIEFIGRKDDQVKIRGYRIELGEIEAVLGQQAGVRDAVVTVCEDALANKRLVAYITAHTDEVPLPKQLKDALLERLPNYMVPDTIMVLDKIPLTPNGKVDRKALPMPIKGLPENFVAPSTPLERELAEIWGSVLGLDQPGVEDNFFEIGGTSLLGLQLIARIQKHYDADLRPVMLYQYPTIRVLARYLSEEKDTQPTCQSLLAPRSQVPTDGIAIIGMAGRFPGANTIEEFWQNLCLGVESITFFTETELDASVPTDLRADPNYVRARGIVDEAESFDAAFFGISPREAEVMDPQARVFLELAYTALENAGYNPEVFPGQIGLYAGSGQNTYFERHLCGRSEIIDRLGAFQTMLANEKDFVTTRTSYKLNLTGPSLSINTGCSTSLVAVTQAFHALANGQCDIALAGGISITTPQNTGYLYQEGGMLSPDGRCRPFDAQAQGTMFNNGAAIVVLKRLEEATADGDRIYAAIKGVGINNDGSDKVSFTAPSINGQKAAILSAQANAGIAPETITYVETHGTATALGDPIEVEALTQVFQTQTLRKQFCALGSVKSNVGHLVAAAGATGLIKTALALYYKQIPPSLNFQAPNLQIDFADSPFYVNTQLTDWHVNDIPRRAGVSSFGVGGTNAHVILEEVPQPSSPSFSRPWQLLLLSAKTETALQQITANMQNHLRQYPNVKLADMAYTLQLGRKGFNQRRFAVCRDASDAIHSVETLDANRTATRLTEKRNPAIVFMFPGQGSQYVNMGRNLYDLEPIFRTAIDECSELLKPFLNRDLREILYPTACDADTAASLLRQTIYTQPALFAVEYALAQLWQSWGVKPSALIGHSIGEFVAACLANVFSLADALKLVATRASLMWNLPGGSMLSVRLPASEVERRLSKELAIAAINGPSLCVVSGPTQLIAELQQKLELEEVVCKLLHTSHAFHSPMMEPIIEPFTEVVKDIQLSPPQIPFVSTVTAAWITNEQATDPYYWASHLRATVRFAEGVQTLWQSPDCVLLEVGPRNTATILARQQAKNLKQQIAIASLGSSADDDTEWFALMQAIGHLWLAGISLDWQAFYANEFRQRVPLPTYPFERKRYWIDPLPASASTSPQPAVTTINSSLNEPATASVFIPTETQSQPMTNSRKQHLIPVLKEVVENTSGLDLASVDAEATFLEMGLDSLSLTQVAIALKKRFKVKIAFRNLLEDYPNLETLATFLDQSLPPDALPAPEPLPTIIAPDSSAVSTSVTTIPLPANGFASNQPEVRSNGQTSVSHNGASAGISSGSSTIETLVAQQLQIMTQQLELLNQARGTTVPGSVLQENQPPAPPAVSTNGKTTATNSATSTSGAAPTAETPVYKSKGPGAKIEKSSNVTLTVEQRAALDLIITRYTSRTQESKRQTQEHRRYLADPRTVSGFTPLLKEVVYPIVTDRSAGSKLWDIDGNEYVDLTNGFGLNFFGWNPDFVKEAVIHQMEKGIEIGPQTPLAGKVAKLITEFTGMERVAFCNTGSEAVMATLRLARTITGRDLVATFTGDYHGTFDEVLYRPGANLKTMPAAPGILPCMFENLLVLDYGTPESLEILRNRADDLAAILAEPVRSRDPGLQPKEFLQDLRHLTEQSGTAYIFDEVVTGFRVHPGGAQAYFGIQADMATYGKVVGGGLPIGIVAGKAEYMDALDGGFWQYGDDSIPEVGVTFFAGTFVRHPMALAAAEAVLLKLKEGGSDLQRSLAEKVHKFATQLNHHFERVGAPIRIDHFTSYFYISYPAELPYAQLLFYLLREKGVHVWDHRPCFFTLSHTDNDIEFVIRSFKDSVAELQAIGFLPSVTPAQVAINGNGKIDRNRPPQAGARLGKDPQGNPAWFIPDLDRPGKYLQVGGVS